MLAGTLFVAASIAIEASAEIADQINASFFPCASSRQLQAATAQLLVLYPDIPALGCPFDTGNDTFGISPVFKQAAALCESLAVPESAAERLASGRPSYSRAAAILVPDGG